MQCSHCSSDANIASDNSRFNFDGLAKFVSSINTDTILYLSGGEPLLVPDLPNRIVELLGKNVTIGMYSSGVKKFGGYRHVSVAEAIGLRGSGLSECYFSIYDSIPGNHDAVTRLSGSYGHTIQSIKNFIAAGIDTKAHVVLNRYSMNHVGDVIKSLTDLGVRDVRLLSLARSGRAKINWDEIGVDNSYQIDILQSILQRSSDFECRLTFSGIPELTPCRPLNPEAGCVAGTKLLYITFDGNIFPCASTRNKPNYSIGNIDSSSFEMIQPPRIDKTVCLSQIVN